MSTSATPAISRAAQNWSSVSSWRAFSSGAGSPSSSRSRSWNMNASASVKAVFGTPRSSVWSISLVENTCSQLWPNSWTAML